MVVLTLVQFQGRPYKIARFNRWLVIISNPSAVEELYSAPENELSAIDAISEVISGHLVLIGILFDTSITDSRVGVYNASIHRRPR